MTLEELFFPVAIAVIAAAYAALGQAGATGYIAPMRLAGNSPDIIRPAALALNTLVATIGTVRFAQAGFITWRATYPCIDLGLDRYWRNARTISSHNPRVYRDRIVGDFAVNGTTPPPQYRVGQP